jgi:hypothetical protein
MSKTSAFKDLQKHWAKQAKDNQKKQEQKAPAVTPPEASESSDEKARKEPSPHRRKATKS